MRGFSITGMILGIVGADTGITAVVFSVLASGGGIAINGFAITGMVLGIVGAVISAAAIVFSIIGFAKSRYR